MAINYIYFWEKLIQKRKCKICTKFRNIAHHINKNNIKDLYMMENLKVLSMGKSY